MPLRERYGVDITPLSYVPGGKIEKYLGNLNFFLIRESTSVRENGGISGFVHSFITEVGFYFQFEKKIKNLIFFCPTASCNRSSTCNSFRRKRNGLILHD